MTRSRTLALLFVSAVAVLTASCGGGDHIAQAIPDSGTTLEGTVKVGGETVYFAMVTAKAANGETATAYVQDDGKYKMSNVPVGDVQIAVNTAAATGDYQQAQMQAGAMGDGKGGRKRVNVKMLPVKEQYADPTKSGLRTVTKAGANTFDIELPASAKK